MKHFTIIFMILLFGNLFSQTYMMKIERLNNTTDSIPLSSVKRIYFSANPLNDTTGMIAYYPFTDGSANDYSGKGNHGVKNNVTATTNRFGLPNSAMSFNGTTSYISIANSSSLQNISRLSISLWVNFSKGGNGSPRMVSKSYGNGLELYMVGTDSLNSVGVQASSPTFHSNKTLYSGTWYHIVFQCDGTNSSFYINGVKDSTKTIVALFSNVNNLILGRSTNLNTVDNFKGSLDDIRIYNRMLTDSEINSLYLSGN